MVATTTRSAPGTPHTWLPHNSFTLFLRMEHKLRNVSKKIIGLNINSKLCHQGNYLAKQQAPAIPPCTNHSRCTMNVDGNVPIGNEKEAAKAIVQTISTHGIYVSLITSDGDSQAHEGVKLAQECKPVPILKYHGSST